MRTRTAAASGGVNALSISDGDGRSACHPPPCGLQGDQQQPALHLLQATEEEAAQRSSGQADDADLESDSAQQQQQSPQQQQQQHGDQGEAGVCGAAGAEDT